MTTESSYGMWWDPGEPSNKVAGHLTWESLRTPTLSLLDPPMRMWAGANLASGQAIAIADQSVAMLHGLLADKGAVTLLACEFGGMHFGKTSTHQLRIGHVLTGVWLNSPDEACLRRVEVDLPALEALLGRHPVIPVGARAPRSRQIRLELDHRRHSWREGTTEATWEYRSSTSVGTTTTRVEMTPTLVLTSARPKSLDYWVDEWIVPINQLMTVATGTKSNPRSITAWMKKNLNSMERHTTGFTIWSRGVGRHEYDYDQHRVLMGAGAIDLNPHGLPDVIRRTRRLSMEHEVFLA